MKSFQMTSQSYVRSIPELIILFPLGNNLLTLYLKSILFSYTIDLPRYLGKFQTIIDKQ